MNYNTGHAENSGSNGVKQQNTIRPNSFWEKQILALLSMHCSYPELI